MTASELVRHRSTFPAVAVGAILVAGLTHGPTGAGGMALGLGSTAFGLYALWRVVRLVGDSCGDRRTPPLEALGAVAALLLKFPVLFGGHALAQKLGDGAPSCFLGGLGLVYCALIVWALATS